MGKPRNSPKYPTYLKYPKVKKIAGNTRWYFSTLLPDLLPGILSNTRPDLILKNPTRWALDQRRTEIINPKVGPPPVSSCHDPPPSTGMYDQFRAVPLLVYRTKIIQLNIFFQCFPKSKAGRGGCCPELLLRPAGHLVQLSLRHRGRGEQSRAVEKYFFCLKHHPRKMPS